MLARTFLRRAFSTFNANVPIVDTSKFLSNPGECLQDCKQVAKAFHETSCLLIRDPRVSQADINGFMDLMEAYFESRGEKYYNGQTDLEDFYPHYGFQTGATPDQLFLMKNYSEIIDKFEPQYKPTSKCPPVPDSKWRYLYRVGERSQDDKHLSVDPPIHVPKDFPQWKTVMDKVGFLLLNGVHTVSEMLALGLGLEQKLFSNMLLNGPQELAPSASDLARYKTGTALSGFHYDLNFLTIHGKNRYPGLYIWLKNGQKATVSVPEGHLLLQVGKQLEMLTGGYLQAGFHEVIYNEVAKKMIDEKKYRSTWRINTTLFASCEPDVILQPLEPFATKEAKEKYPPITCQKQMEEEFKDMNMTQEIYQILGGNKQNLNQ